MPDHNIVPPGWQGGFLKNNPQFNYPDPDMSSLDFTANMDYITNLTRMQKAFWPEFSWETAPGNPASRCFQMFAPDISRIGYDDTGRAWSIICPQQGLYISEFGCLNVEVTVTGQRGWVDEPNYTMAADIKVVGQIWFSPSTYDQKIYQDLVELCKILNLPFPLTKANAIRVNLLNNENPALGFLPVRMGQTPLINQPAPEFTQHEDAWEVVNVNVQIGSIQKIDPIVDEFNTMLMTLFNLGSGNLLAENNVLSWNIWAGSPELVDQAEWQAHAEKWRESIDANHGSPGGSETTPRLADGSPYSVLQSLIDAEIAKIEAWLKSLFDSKGLTNN